MLPILISLNTKPPCRGAETEDQGLNLYHVRAQFWEKLDFNSLIGSGTVGRFSGPGPGFYLGCDGFISPDLCSRSRDLRHRLSHSAGSRGSAQTPDHQSLTRGRFSGGELGLEG